MNKILVIIVVAVIILAACQSQTCTAQADTHLRNRAGETSRAVGPVLAGDVLTLTGSEQDGWLETDAGWIDGELCK
jgi:uncharacterized protein YgiM (DUF1202 family)